VTWANEYADDPKTTWPGMPISDLPLVCRDQRHAAIRDGMVEIVGRPATVQNPDGTRTVSYIAPIR